MTQPAAGNPREQRKNPTAQLACWIDAEVRKRLGDATPGHGQLRAFVERALRRELDDPSPYPADAES